MFRGVFFPVARHTLGGWGRPAGECAGIPCVSPAGLYVVADGQPVACVCGPAAGWPGHRRGACQHAVDTGAIIAHAAFGLFALLKVLVVRFERSCSVAFCPEVA